MGAIGTSRRLSVNVSSVTINLEFFDAVQSCTVIVTDWIFRAPVLYDEDHVLHICLFLSNTQTSKD